MKSKKSKNMAPHKPNPVEPFRSIMEGRAILRITSENVFYNPVQEFNRDLSIVALTIFIEDFKEQKLLEAEERRKKLGVVIDNETEEDKPEITILEALSATGLRSIRYAKELLDVTKIVANDISLQAVETINDNISFNNVDHIVVTSNADAGTLMQNHKSKTNQFSAVDLDPYGSPVTFLAVAVQSVAEGGMLLVTATDMAVLAGNSPVTCYTKYLALSLKMKCCHEMAIRLLLRLIEVYANAVGRYIVPMLSVSADFYIRVFVRVYTGAGEIYKTPSKFSKVYQCTGCESMTFKPMCEYIPNPSREAPNRMKAQMANDLPETNICKHCNHKIKKGGPIWSAPIHDQSFVERALELVTNGPGQALGTSRRLEGMLSVISEELPIPLYYTLDRLCSVVRVEMIPIIKFRSALLHAGYQVSFSHANKLSVKTNAPNEFIWDVMRAWTELRPVKATTLEVNPVAKNILSKPRTAKVEFSLRSDANPDSRRTKRARFPYNPTANWGPGCRATVNTYDNANKKALRNQNKRKARWIKLNKKRFSKGDVGMVFENAKQQKIIINTSTSETGSDVAPDTVDDLATDVTSKPSNGVHGRNVCSTGTKVAEDPQPGTSQDPADAKH